MGVVTQIKDLDNTSALLRFINSGAGNSPDRGNVAKRQKVIPLVGEMGEAQKDCRRAKVAVRLRRARH